MKPLPSSINPGFIADLEVRVAFWAARSADSVDRLPSVFGPVAFIARELRQKIRQHAPNAEAASLALTMIGSSCTGM
jgi:hypothetical protein